MDFTNDELERLITVLINSDDNAQIDGPLYLKLSNEQEKRFITEMNEARIWKRD